jgi:hypothetical protein
MTGHDSRRVAPFGNPRVKGCLAPHRGLSQPTASFIACRRQGIHQLPLVSFATYLILIPSFLVKERTEPWLGPEPREVSRLRTNPVALRDVGRVGQADAKETLVEVNGIEPMTSCVQGRRSPS